MSGEKTTDSPAAWTQPTVKPFAQTVVVGGKELFRRSCIGCGHQTALGLHCGMPTRLFFTKDNHIGFRAERTDQGPKDNQWGWSYFEQSKTARVAVCRSLNQVLVVHTIFIRAMEPFVGLRIAGEPVSFKEAEDESATELVIRLGSPVLVSKRNELVIGWDEPAGDAEVRGILEGDHFTDVEKATLAFSIHTEGTHRG